MDSQSGLRLLRSGERAVDLDDDEPLHAAAPQLGFAVADPRAGALEVRAWGERIVFLLRPRGRVVGADPCGVVLDDGGERVAVKWSFPPGVPVPPLLARRVRVEHRVEMARGAAVAESLVVVDELDGCVLLAAHEGSLERAPASFPVERHGTGVRAARPEQRRTHDLAVLSRGARRRIAFVATHRES